MRCNSILIHSIFAILILGLSTLPTYADNHHGHFEGELLVQFLENETNVVVKSPIKYVDPAGVDWAVPIDFKTDGASVPRFAWIAFPPFSGLYIRAAVVHDYYCVARDRPWREVHRVFYDAMLAAGVDGAAAKTMYAAVYAFGPRWSMQSADRSVSLSSITTEDQEFANSQLSTWVKEERPSLDEIDLYVNRERLRQSPLSR